MKKIILTCLTLAFLITAGCATKRKVNVQGTQRGEFLEVVKEPIYSVNLIKKEIPKHLREMGLVYQAPESCRAFWEEITLLDDVLGDDLIDRVGPEQEVITVHLGQMLGDQVASNIPFNSIVKSLSGAKKHEKKRLSAQVRGKARRSYLKGWADAANCNDDALAIKVINNSAESE